MIEPGRNRAAVAGLYTFTSAETGPPSLTSHVPICVRNTLRKTVTWIDNAHTEIIRDVVQRKDNVLNLVPASREYGRAELFCLKSVLRLL